MATADADVDPGEVYDGRGLYAVGAALFVLFLTLYQVAFAQALADLGALGFDAETVDTLAFGMRLVLTVFLAGVYGTVLKLVYEAYTLTETGNRLFRYARIISALALIGYAAYTGWVDPVTTATTEVGASYNEAITRLQIVLYAFVGFYRELNLGLQRVVDALDERIGRRADDG